MAATNKKIRVRKGTDNAIRDFSDRLNDNTALFTLVPELYGTGTSNTYRKCVAKGLYDFSVLTGAIGSYNLLSTDEVIPDNAIVTNVYIDVITAFTSTGGTGTIALTLNTAGDLLAAVDADTLSTGPNAGINGLDAFQFFNGLTVASFLGCFDFSSFDSFGFDFIFALSKCFSYRLSDCGLDFVRHDVILHF